MDKGPACRHVDNHETSHHRPLAARLRLVPGASDLDGDGRIDLFDDSFYTFDYGGKDAQVEVLPIVAHTLPNGTFTRDDAVTRAFYVERCRDLGKPPWRKGRYDEAALLNIACARVFGVDAKTISRALAREVRRPETDELLSNEGFEAWVSRTPPITLTR